MTFLLDVNVLIALIDPAHVGHDAAHRWFEARGRESWATCPLTENGVIGIVSHPNYPGAPGHRRRYRRRASVMAGHVFWPDDISLVGVKHVEAKRILTSGQVTDSYLLALAVAHDGIWRHSIAAFNKSSEGRKGCPPSHQRPIVEGHKRRMAHAQPSADGRRVQSVSGYMTVPTLANTIAKTSQLSFDTFSEVVPFRDGPIGDTWPSS